MIDLPLNPCPSDEWQAEFDRLTATPYLAQKYNRERGLAENLEYIRQFCPWIEEGPRWPERLVLDIGPGFGHFTEWCRHFGWKPIGIEAADGDNGMGDDYLEVAHALHMRQRLEVHYLVDGIHSYRGTSDLAEIINFRGAWAQIWADYVEGPPHHEHHDVRQQWWGFTDDLRDIWRHTFWHLSEWLGPEGHLLISANRLGDKANQEQFAAELKAAAEDAGLVLELEHEGYTFRWRREQ